MKAFMRVVMAGILSFVAGAVWATHRPGEAVPEPETGGREVIHSALEIVDTRGEFDGTITLTNRTSAHAKVLVQVHIYEGDQALGELSGLVTLKPESSSSVDLTSYDSYREYTDTTVELITVPATTTA